jgi:hypothetical protein
LAERGGRTIGILTEDFRLFYDLAEALKRMNVPFASLSFRHGVPGHIGVVLTSPGEAERVFFETKVAVDGDVIAAVRRALSLLHQGEGFELLVVGVDPGEMPGIAVLGDGRVLETCRALSPEDAGARILEVCLHYSAESVVVRVGHGDRENRNRILRAICGRVQRCEIVDETHTTPHPSTTDMDSAVKIARSSGVEVHAPPELRLTPGKVRDIQRRSRIGSDGLVTLSKSEAEDVASGRLTMDEAIRRKRSGR